MFVHLVPLDSMLEPHYSAGTISLSTRVANQNQSFFVVASYWQFNSFSAALFCEIVIGCSQRTLSYWPSFHVFLCQEWTSSSEDLHLAWWADLSCHYLCRTFPLLSVCSVRFLRLSDLSLSFGSRVVSRLLGSSLCRQVWMPLAWLFGVWIGFPHELWLFGPNAEMP